MATARLVASSYSVTGTVVVNQNETSLYANTDNSSNPARITHTTSGTTSYYLYLKGFNFSTIPSNAVVSSFEIKVKGYESSLSTSTSYAPRLYNNSSGTTWSSITGASAATTNFGTSTNTITVPYTGDWDTLKSYGSNLGIRLVIRRSNRNTQGYLYIYGAEINVTYTIPVYHTVSITGDTTPTGTQTVLEGTDLSISCVATVKPTVTDNNVDVTSQVTESSGGSTVYVPSGNTTSNFTVTNISNAYNPSSNSSNYASLEINGGTTGTCYLNIPVNLPSGATVTSVACSAALQFSRNNSSSGFTSSIQMYSNNTAKGSSTTWVSSATDVSRTVYNLTVGSWTVSELANARFYLTATNNASSTHRFIYIYGVSLTVTYSVDGKIYTYTLTNITADHVVVFTAGQATSICYVKINGSWVQASTVYKKVSGSWQQVSPDQAFSQGVNYKFSAV